MFLSLLVEEFSILLVAEALIRNGRGGNVKFKINGNVYCSFTFVLPEAENILFCFVFIWSPFNHRESGLAFG